MASKPRLSLHPSPRTAAALLLLLVAEAHAHGANNRASSDVANAVPQCAQDCFRSFVDVNFPNIDCGDSPSAFECICQHTGASGFTAGEGAIQCLLAAKAVGICTGADVDQTRMDSAYRMCRGQPDASQPTHSTIQATLRLDGSSRLIVPTLSLRTSVIASRTINTPTGNPNITPSSATATASLPQTLTRPTETESASSPGDLEGAEDAGSSPPPRGLGTAEIAGLVAGLVAALAMAFIAICISRRRRKKHFPDMETSFFMRSEKLKAISRRFTILPTGENISAPLHRSPREAPRQFPLGPHAALESRRGTFIFPKPAPTPAAAGLPETEKIPSTAWVAPGAGLAVAAATAASLAAGRTASPPRAQPKPVLSITIPEISAYSAAVCRRKPVPVQDGLPPRAPAAAPTPERAQGVARSGDLKSRAPAAEDDDDGSQLTEFEEDGRDGPVQIWRPPSAAPQSAAATLYFADKAGNWVLADPRRRTRIPVAELEGSSPVVAVGGGDSAMPTDDGTSLRPPAEIYRQDEAKRGIPSAVPRSSAYPTPSSSSHAGNPSHGHFHPAVDSLVPKPLATRQSQRQPRPSSRQRYSPALNPFLDENGVSPVRSPCAAAPRHAAHGLGPPGGRPQSPPGQPSPTLGATDSVSPASSARHAGRAPRRTCASAPPAAFATTRAPRPSPTTLLAKRVGAEKAAGLSLRGDSKASSSRGGGGGGGGRRGFLPSTPTWKPLLTPERRGDDLYLSLR